MELQLLYEHAIHFRNFNGDRIKNSSQKSQKVFTVQAFVRKQKIEQFMDGKRCPETRERERKCQHISNKKRYLSIL